MNVTTLDYSMRRRHPRVEMVGRVFVHNEEHLYIAPLHNISLGGIFIERVVTIDIGQEVKVVVKAPGLTEPIQAIG
ncbi:MAG: PilZ domain-containing protein, partial [Proteobacteria bacterium]|nr:PilZ domain-containing protein [Pseudomonadota bacterium]NDG28443.1 PilZ domain-containing protein [Pseudomonadota bacterium]